MRRPGALILALYLLAGVIVAAVRGYFENLGSVGDFVELLVAILLWPLILLGVNINIGGLDGPGGGGPNGPGGGGGGGGGGG